MDPHVLAQKGQAEMPVGVYIYVNRSRDRRIVDCFVVLGDGFFFAKRERGGFRQIPAAQIKVCQNGPSVYPLG
jgi:hypothetical protein